MGLLCKDYCPIASKGNAVVATSHNSDIRTFPEGFAIPDPLTATPQSIILFLEYQRILIEVVMHEQVGDWKTSNQLTARRLMLQEIPEGAEVVCGLNHAIAERIKSTKGTGSISIRGGSDCPYLPENAFVFGGVTAIDRSTI